MPAASMAQVVCFAYAANQPSLRQEGMTERAGDIILNCTGSPTGSQTGPQNLQVFMNLAAITSRQLYSGTSAPANIPTEAALLVNDCTTNSGYSSSFPTFSCANSGSFTSGIPTQGFLVSSNNALLFSGFTFPTATNGSFQIRITNLRVNAHDASAGAFVNATVLATFPVQNQSGIILGVVEPTLALSVSSVSDFSGCAPFQTPVTS